MARNTLRSYLITRLAVILRDSLLHGISCLVVVVNTINNPKMVPGLDQVTYLSLLLSSYFPCTTALIRYFPCTIATFPLFPLCYCHFSAISLVLLHFPPISPVLLLSRKILYRTIVIWRTCRSGERIDLENRGEPARERTAGEVLPSSTLGERISGMLK
jgi:hypothetical protein